MTRRRLSERSRPDAMFEEHRALREIVARLRNARHRKELTALLAEFHDAARDHFAMEEASDGFFVNVTAAAPRHAVVLAELRAEHATLLVDVDWLIARAGSCAEPALADVLERVQSLASRLERHEERENEILQDVMNTDLGGLG